MPETIPFTYSYSHEHKASHLLSFTKCSFDISQFQSSISLVYNRRNQEQIDVVDIQFLRIIDTSPLPLITNNDQLFDKNKKLPIRYLVFTFSVATVFDPNNLKEYVEVEDDPSSHRDHSKYMNPKQD